MNEDIKPNSGDSQKPFKLEGHQFVIYERLNRLVGPGAADFYKDACRMLVVQPPFLGTTHVVAHLLREVEAALRAVLKSLKGKPESQEAQTAQIEDFLTKHGITGEEFTAGGLKVIKQGESHKAEIKEILKQLGIGEEDPISKAWFNLTDRGRDSLYGRAHRRNLDAARPVDEDFGEMWDHAAAVLGAVLDKFEGQYTRTFETIDLLAKKDAPSKEDARLFLINTPNNFVARSRFFDQLTNPAWLPILRAAGFFEEAPPPEHNEEEHTMRYPVWSPAKYLAKMASVKPVEVADIILNVKDNDNAFAKANLLTIAENLPLTERLTLVEKAKEWIRAKNHFYTSDATKKLIEKFGDEGSVEAALELTKVLLEVLPDEQTNVPEHLRFLSREPRTRMEEWFYAEFLRKDFQKLVALDPEKAHQLVSQLLLDFVTLKYAHYAEHNYDDALHISRPSIGEKDINRHYDRIEHVLIDAVRDTGRRIIEKDPDATTKIVSDLEEKKWSIFRRLALHLLSEAPDSARELIVQRLTDQSLFDDYSFREEYALLAERKFDILTAEEQGTILDWIEKAESITKRIQESRENKTDISDEQAEKIKERWQRDKLSYLGSHLSGAWKERRDALLKAYGDPEPSDGVINSYVGPTSEINAQQLVEMDEAAIVETLKTWQPKSDRFGFGPSKEGLGREITAAIKLNPEHFNDMAKSFKGLDPTYVRSYIGGYSQIIQNDVSPNWPAMLELCRWVMDQPRGIPGRTGGDMDQDPDWAWARKSIASLVAHGANANQLPYDLREKLWSIIEPLTEDPDPKPEDEAVRDDSFMNDAYTLTINTTRGEAMVAVVEYALWVYRSIDKLPEGKETLKGGLNVMPEVKAVLEKHLDPQEDPSIAVRAVYGRFFPWFLLIDEPWTLTNLDKIFPPGEFGEPLYNAAWDTYIMYLPAYDRPFLVLKERYKEAVKNLGKVDKNKRRFTDRDEKLAAQLMIFYWRGKLSASDDIFRLFWENPDGAARGYAISFIGHTLKNDSETPPPDVIAKLKSLWEGRIAAAKAAGEKTPFEFEMAAFAWWFVSGKFDDEWVMDQYSAALDVAKKDQADYFVMNRLVELVKTSPLKAVKILAKILLMEGQPEWTVLGNKNDIVAILAEALSSQDATVREEATNLINRMVAKGHTDFNDLLPKK